jgi:hypothetical protein
MVFAMCQVIDGNGLLLQLSKFLKDFLHGCQRARYPQFRASRHFSTNQMNEFQSKQLSHLCRQSKNQIERTDE